LCSGGAGADALTADDGNNRFDGGLGSDRAIYAGSDARVTVNLATGTGWGGHAEGDTLTRIEHLTGSAFADRLTGDDGGNWLDGGASADTLYGGEGFDRAIYAGSDAGVTVNLATGTGRGGHAEGDVLTGIENLTGSAFADRLTGDGCNNRLDGGAGVDLLNGGAGNDRLTGSAARMSLSSTPTTVSSATRSPTSRTARTASGYRDPSLSEIWTLPIAVTVRRSIPAPVCPPRPRFRRPCLATSSVRSRAFIGRTVPPAPVAFANKPLTCPQAPL